MHLILSDGEGRRTEAIVLAFSTDRMRISIPDCEDSIELKLEQERWISDAGAVFEIEAVITGSDASSWFRHAVPAAQAAAASRDR